MQQKITKITIVSGAGVQVFEVGVDRVEKIEDHSVQIENALHYSYLVKNKDNKALAHIENCPVVKEFLT